MVLPWFCVFHLCLYHTFLSHWLWSAWTAAVFLKYSSCIIGIHYSWVLQSAYELVSQQHSVLKRASIERLDLNSTRAAVRGHWDMENTSRGVEMYVSLHHKPCRCFETKELDVCNANAETAWGRISWLLHDCRHRMISCALEWKSQSYTFWNVNKACSVDKHYTLPQWGSAQKIDSSIGISAEMQIYLLILM